MEIYSRLSNVYSTGHTDASTVYSESIESIIDLLSSIGTIVPIGEMDTQGRWCRYADDHRLRRNFGQCRWGRWCQASVVGHSLRPATSVRCGGRKAVSRIRQSSRAGQPNTSGSMRDLLAAEPLRKSHIKGKEVWETVAGGAVHRLPSGLSPQPPGEIIAREAEYRRERQCPESGRIT